MVGGRGEGTKIISHSSFNRVSHAISQKNASKKSFPDFFLKKIPNASFSVSQIKVAKIKAFPVAFFLPFFRLLSFLILLVAGEETEETEGGKNIYSSKNEEPRGRDDDDGESGKKARRKRKEEGGGGGGEVQETRTDVVMGEKNT